jgi:hypothetical protein
MTRAGLTYSGHVRLLDREPACIDYVEPAVESL